MLHPFFLLFLFYLIKKHSYQSLFLILYDKESILLMIPVGQHGSASKLVLEELQIEEVRIIIGGTVLVSNGLSNLKLGLFLILIYDFFYLLFLNWFFFFFFDNLRFYSKTKQPEGYTKEPRTKACSELITSENQYKTISYSISKRPWSQYMGCHVSFSWGPLEF